MQRLTNLLITIGVLVIIFAIIWHIWSAITVVQATGNAACLFSLKKSAPSNVATFGNAFMLMAILIMLSQKKQS